MAAAGKKTPAVIFFAIFAVFNAVVGVSSENCLDKENQPITTCTACLRRKDCVWCPEKTGQDLPAVGCVVRSSHDCKVGVVESRPRAVIERNDPLGKGGFRRSAVQLSPQEIRLTASPNVEAKIGFRVALADVPVDIYFVMDLSNSMRIHKNNLIRAAGDIALKVSELTKDYQLGFGSFSDKPTAPFSYGSRKTLRSPPYSFQHQMKLTKDIDRFREGVRDSSLAGNIDSPESGMDALMQAITCKEAIGWRDEVRKVIIFVTDQDTHFAYDGKLGGIPFPQDQKCHLSGSGGYTEALNQDYPSFSQIRHQLNVNNVTVIFAVEEYMDAIYRELSDFIQGAVNVGHLTGDSSSLEEIVTRQYRDIKSRIELQVNSSHPEQLEVKVGGNCRNPSNNRFTCSNVAKDTVVSYEVSVLMQDSACGGGLRQHDDSNNKWIRFAMRGFPNDALSISLECERCRCSGDQHPARGDVCNGRGDVVCGGCECREGFMGKACECDVSEGGGGGGGGIKEEQCLTGGGQICNGRGRCFCGLCRCDDAHLGKFCQCRRDSCPKGGKGGGETCSGNGICQCGGEKEDKTGCSCDPGWSGPVCGCPSGDHQCRDYRTGEVCFGRGKCECGRCSCESGFEGRYCQRETAESTCQKLEPCVKRFQFGQAEEELTAGQREEWEEDCLRMTSHGGQQMFGRNIGVGCPHDDSETQLLYRQQQGGGCNATVAFFKEQNSNNSGNANQPPASKVRQIGTEGMERCVGNHQRCEFVFYHDIVDGYFDERRLGRVLIVHHKDVNGTWRPLSTCSAVPLVLIVSSTVGTLLLVGMGLLVAAVVVININDLWRWQQYQAWESQNVANLPMGMNPLYVEKEDDDDE